MPENCAQKAKRKLLLQKKFRFLLLEVNLFKGEFRKNPESRIYWEQFRLLLVPGVKRPKKGA
jgi:hypothetical protein